MLLFRATKAIFKTGENIPLLSRQIYNYSHLSLLLERDFKNTFMLLANTGSHNLESHKDGHNWISHYSSLGTLS